MEKHDNTNKPWSAGMRSPTGEVSDFFVIERQVGKLAEMLNLHLKSGEQRAFPVTAFDEIAFRPGEGISLHCRVATITVTGRNLQNLYHALTQRRVKEIREFSSEETKEDQCYVETVQVHSDYDRH